MDDHLIDNVRRSLEAHYAGEAVLAMWNLADQHAPYIQKELKRLAIDLQFHPADHIDETLWKAHANWFETIVTMIGEAE